MGRATPAGVQPDGAIPASRCSCGGVAAPPTRFCHRCGRETEATSLPNFGTILSYTILHSPPAGFSAPLSIALVELAEGVKFICHGHTNELKGLKVGRQVRIESGGNIYYFSAMTFRERAELFWRRRGETTDKVKTILKTLFRRSP